MKKLLKIALCLTLALFVATGLTSCKHDTTKEPEVEYCNEDGCVKEGEILPHEHNYCELGDKCYSDRVNDKSDPDHECDPCEVESCKEAHTDTNGVHTGWSKKFPLGEGYEVPYIDVATFNNNGDGTTAGRDLEEDKKIELYKGVYNDYVQDLCSKLSPELKGIIAKKSGIDVDEELQYFSAGNKPPPKNAKIFSSLSGGTKNNSVNANCFPCLALFTNSPLNLYSVPTATIGATPTTVKLLSNRKTR